MAAGVTARSPFSLLLLSLLLLTLPSFSLSFSFFHYRTLISLSHSLATRVANLRASRGDLEGSFRARSLAHHLERGLGLGFWKVMWNMGWDYARNYAWSGTMSFEMLEALADLNDLLRSLNELSRANSDRSYQNVLRVSKSLLHRLVTVFRRPGPLKDVVETVRKEVVEGDLLRDCLEVGSNDLKGLIQVFKDIASQYASTSSGQTEL